MPDPLEHLPLPGPELLSFRYPGSPRDDRPLPSRDPVVHAARLRDSLQRVEADIAEVSIDRAGEASGHLVAAEIAPDSPANLDALSDRRRDNAFVGVSHEGVAVVHFRHDDFAPLRWKLAQYEDPEKVTKSGLPRNARLLSPIEDFRLADIRDLSDGWLTAESLDPAETYWVELWLRGGWLTPDELRSAATTELSWFLDVHGIARERVHAYRAMEHDIYLAPIRGDALVIMPVQVPDVYRVTPPEVADVPFMLEHQADLLAQGANAPPDNATVVALLDTGVAENHPLLQPGILAPGRSVVVGASSAADTHGHGTRMAGVAGYSDLGGQLGSGSSPAMRNRLQNVRVMEAGTAPASDLPLWPERMVDAIAEAEQDPAPRRIFNLSIGAVPANPGDRTAWGASVDALAYNAGAGRLICVAAGNVKPPAAIAPTYPHENLAAGITSPGEAINAVTVGAMTRLCDAGADAPSHSVVARTGELSPWSRCDVGGVRPIKPDVVLEGGNWITDGVGARPTPETSLLTTSREHAIGPPLTITCATSAACAGVSGLLAEIWRANPGRAPQTIRGLLVHSARWGDAMWAQMPNRQDRCRAFGYGEPNVDLASYSFRDHPTLILESTIYPERRIGDGREMHFVRLPLPDVALRQLGSTEVELSVTLSYFIEPNENRIRRYEGAGLRWGIQRPLESEGQFRQRINRLERTDGYGGAVDDLAWEIGPQARARGTIQSDRCRTTAQELLGSRAIGVWPVGGWWRGRNGFEDMPVRYALLVTIDAGDTNVDLYTEIENLIRIAVEV